MRTLVYRLVEEMDRDLVANDEVDADKGGIWPTLTGC